MRLLFLIFICISAIPPARAASFNCLKASTLEEHTICNDPQLSNLDSLLGRAFSEAKKSSAADVEDKAKLMSVAQAFLEQRQTCSTRRSCIVSSYVGALEGYITLGSTVEAPAWVDAPTISDGDAPSSTSLPTEAGHCVSTKVTTITPRLGDGGPIKPEDFDSGTAINFGNGGYQVSYDKEPALLSSRRGDPVIMCLVWISQQCPKGDDRGRFYLVTNMRTHRTWTLPDSEHMCGGA